jgi:hypothetical protein
VSNELHNYELPWQSWIKTLEGKLEEKIDIVNNRVNHKIKKTEGFDIGFKEKKQP